MTKKTVNMSEAKAAVMNVKFQGDTVLCGECGEKIGKLLSVDDAIAEAQKMGYAAIPVPADVVAAMGPTTGARKSIAKMIEEARQDGKDVGEFYALTNGQGEGMVYRLVDGVPTAVQDNDPVLMKILGGIEEYGHLAAPSLRRRFVTGQMVAVMNSELWGTRRGGGLTGWINAQGFEHAFQVAKQELNYLAHCEKNNDQKSLHEREMWWSKALFVGMAEHFLATLKEYIMGLKVRHCKGVEYRRFHDLDIFCSDLYEKLYWPLQRRISDMKRAKGYQELYEIWSGSKYLPSRMSKRSDWRTLEIKGKGWLTCNLPRETPIYRGYKEAFKGAGAYYTMANLILFQKSNDFRLFRNGKRLTKRQSEMELHRLNAQFAAEGAGYKLYAVLKEFFEDNNICAHSLRQSWMHDRES